MMHDLHYTLKIERLIQVQEITIIDRVERPCLNRLQRSIYVHL